MGKKDVHLVAILDRSGSMSGLTEEMRKGFNELKAQQLKEEGETFVTLTVFDNEITRLYTGTNVKNTPDLTDKDYFPRGSTALLDAVGQTVTDIENRKDLPKKVTLVIATDGYENASTEYNRQKIKDLLAKHQNKKSNAWHVIFMGAGVDAFNEKDYGFTRTASTINVTPDSLGTQSFYNSVSTTMGAYRSGAPAASLDVSGGSNVDYGNNPTTVNNTTTPVAQSKSQAKRIKTQREAKPV
jgi:hypothetical protein